MNAEAHVRDDWVLDGIRLAVTRSQQDGPRQVLVWGQQAIATVDPQAEAPDEAWLRLHRDDARAIYEALAEHFGHTGNDVRALRRDYEAERARVDKFIGHLTGGAS